MTIKRLVTSGSLFLAAATLTVSAAVDAPYEVGTWGNFCGGAISHTFDDYPNDNTTVQTGKGQDAFNEYGLHMTFFVQVGSVSKWDPLKEAFANGHEIASHNWSHNVNSGDFSKSQKAVRDNVPGEKCVTLAYPNCSASDDAGLLKVYIAARNCSGTFNDKSPKNMAQITSQLAGDKQPGYPNSASEFNSAADQAASSNKWAVYGHHGIDAGHGWANTNLSELKKHLDYLDKNRSKIWCETFGNVARYIKERDAASVTKKDSTEKSFTLSVTDDLDDEVFNYPLSIRRPLPDGWDAKDIVVKQDDKEIEDTVVEADSKKYIMFKAVPDGGDIVITNDKIVGVSAEYRINGKVSPVVRQSSLLTINRDYFDGKSITVTFFNVAGKVIGKQTLAAGESAVNLGRNNLSNCTFIAKVTDGRKTFSDIFMPQM